ncbi:MAG: c-type cytochrome [Phycisphaerae bacterium]
MDRKPLRLMKAALLFASASSIVVLAVEAYRENYSGLWRGIQRSYRAALRLNADTERERQSAASFDVAIRQVFLPELRRIDRCTTCHLGVANPEMAGAAKPLAAHPGDLLKHHPVERFGCTICHQGEGRAITAEAAHGWDAHDAPVPNAMTPLLRNDTVYTSCGRCHYEVDLYGGQSDLYAFSFQAGSPDVTKPRITKGILALSLPGADVLVRGKRLVIENGCLGCHRYRGGGGDLGSDLTYVGDKRRHDYDFTHVAGEHTVQQWLYEHFLTPSAVSPDTVMPNMGFSPEEARTLALYMMSLHRKSAPATHMPRPPATTEDTALASGETLYKMFCGACHGATGLGDGPAAATIEGQPRDFWHERFRYVSALNGVPTQEDLVRTISTGRQFGEMPSNPQLTEDEVLAVAEYIRDINRKGTIEKLTEAFSDDDEVTPEDIEEIAETRLTPKGIVLVPWPGADFQPDTDLGTKLYMANCASCHGDEGKGDGPQELVDERGRRIKARDLTTGRLRGGDEPEEIFKRILVGIPGTPMPAQETLNDNEVWQLVYHVRALAGLPRPSAKGGEGR